MIFRVLWIALFVWTFVSAEANDIQIHDTVVTKSFVFQATVHDSGTFQGAECRLKTDKCADYKAKLCAFIRKPLYSLDIPAQNFCSVEILSNRTDENDLDVKVSLQINTNLLALSFNVECPTFAAALNTAFYMLHNTLEAGLIITKVISLQNPQVPSIPTDETVLEVTGSLYRAGKPVDATNLQLSDKCELQKGIFNIDMDGDLLNVMYKYNQEYIHLTKFSAVDPKKVTFKLFYHKEFFQTTNINSQCDFVDKLQWGFRHPVSEEQFYLGNDTTVTLLSTEPDSSASTTKIKYEATINDGGKLGGYGCRDGIEGSCIMYKLKLCEMIQKPLLCLRAPNEPANCDVTKLTRETTNGLMTAAITLGVRAKLNTDGIEYLYPVSVSTCNTFSALHSLTFKTLYDRPKVELKLVPAAITGDVVFKVTGDLYRNEKKLTKDDWDGSDEYEMQYELANLEMPGEILQTFYKYNQQRTVKFISTTSDNTHVAVTFHVTYPKKYFDDNKITSNCDLNEMLKWGFQNTKKLNKYHLGSEANVEMTMSGT